MVDWVGVEAGAVVEAGVVTCSEAEELPEAAGLEVAGCASD